MTKRSKLDRLLDGVDTRAAHILAFSDGGYSANLERLEDGEVSP